MILSLIENHLSSLAEAKSKGISPYKYEDIELSNRPAISAITREMDLSAQAWNKALSSPVLVDFVNRTTLPKAVVESLLNTRYSPADIQKVIDLPYIESVHAKIMSSELNKSSYYYYSSRERLNASDWLVDVLGYISAFGLGEGGLTALLQTVYSMKVNGYTEDHYPLMPLEDRVQMIRMWHTDFVNIDDVPAHERYPYMKSCLPFMGLFEEINEALGTEVTRKIFPSLHRLLSRSDNADKLISEIRLVLDNMSPDIVSEWFVQLFGEKDGLVLDSEIHKLAANYTERYSTNVYEVIYGQNSLAYDVLREAGEYDPHQIVLLKKCIEAGKKGFLRLILHEDARETFLQLGRYNLLFQDAFSQIVNLNTLNKKNLETLSEMHNKSENLMLLNPQIALTFDEFHFLYGKKKLDIDFYYSLMDDFSVGERLRIARELPELSKVSEYFNSEDELLASVRALVRVKPMKQWVKEKGLKLTDAGDHHYLLMLLVPERFEKFKASIKTGGDVDFIMKETELLTIADTLDEAKLMFVEKNEACQFLFEKLNVSREFIQKYKVNIVSFYERGLCEIFMQLHKNKRSKLDDQQLQNLYLITKAELSGKLGEIKFLKDDFELEIGMPISNQVIAEWMHNRTAALRELSIMETYDYETTLRLGQYPEETCQHWNDGSYSRCLLSNFDTNKKLIVVKGRKGHTVARAIIRLTKGSDKYIPKDAPVKKNRLGFIDVEAEPEQEIVKEATKPKEELVLFLERCYTSMDGEIGREVRREIVKLAMEKSKALGAKLVLADEYAEDKLEELKDFAINSYYIFISYSKNGYQYLDSLDGQATESNEGSYNSATVMIQADKA
jgi:hypothetical protein